MPEPRLEGLQRADRLADAVEVIGVPGDRAPDVTQREPVVQGLGLIRAAETAVVSGDRRRDLADALAGRMQRRQPNGRFFIGHCADSGASARAARTARDVAKGGAQVRPASTLGRGAPQLGLHVGEGE